MQVEHDIKVIPINEKFKESVEALSKEGWQLVPGITPVAIYHVVRSEQTKAAAVGGLGQMHIDDSKIHVIKADGSQQ